MREGNELLTNEHVAKWFKHRLGKPWPTPEQVKRLTHYCNLPPPRLTPLQQQEIDIGKEHGSRVRDALDVLISELPRMIAGAEKSLAAAAKEGKPAFSPREIGVEKPQRLLDAALGFDSTLSLRRRRQGRHALWHGKAQMVAMLAKSAWRSAGRNKPLGTSVTGPLVRVVWEALSALGIPQDEDAISKALQGKGKPRKK